MVNVNGGRDWSAATKDCPEFLGSLTQVKYFSTNLITVRAHRGHTWSEATQNPCKFLSTTSVHPLPRRTSKKHHGTLRPIWWGRKVESKSWKLYECIFFLCCKNICSEKRVFVSTFLPFCPVSFWSQLVYGCDEVETRFYLFPKNGVATLQSRPRVLRRSAPVAMTTERLWPSATPSVT